MAKLKEILKETSTWTLGVPSITFGVLTLLKDDNAQAVSQAVQGAGEQYLATGNWVQALGFLGMGVMGIVMRGGR